MNIQKLTDTLWRICFDNGTTLTLVGTAHVSEKSKYDVIRAIDEYHPDSICIELDKARWEKLHDTSENKAISSEDLVTVIKKGKTFLLLANLILSSFQKKLNLNKSDTVGAEIVAAGDIAVRDGIPLTLADRDITITLKRAWGLSGLISKSKMAASLILSAFDKTSISEEELEELKKTSNIEVMLNKIAEDLPNVKTALIDERDQYLAGKIYNATGVNKLAVVGAGHMNGIVNWLSKQESNEAKVDFDSLDFVPKKSRAKKILEWSIPFLIIAIIVAISVIKGIKVGLEMLAIWAVSNALTTLIFGALSLAHPLNLIIGAIASPFAVLSPIIGIGMITGVVEAKLRPPKVSDAETLSDDVSTFKGWFKNRILHVFTVFMFTSIGSVIGTVLVAPIVAGLW